MHGDLPRKARERVVDRDALEDVAPRTVDADIQRGHITERLKILDHLTRGDPSEEVGAQDVVEIERRRELALFGKRECVSATVLEGGCHGWFSSGSLELGSGGEASAVRSLVDEGSLPAGAMLSGWR